MWSTLICFSLHFTGAEHVRVLRHSWAMEAWLSASALCPSGNESCGARVAWHAWRVVLRAHTPPVPGVLDAQPITNPIRSSSPRNAVRTPAAPRCRRPRRCMPEPACGVVGNTTSGFGCADSCSALVDTNTHFTSKSYYIQSLCFFFIQWEEKQYDLAVCLSSSSINHWLMPMVTNEHLPLSGGKSVGNDS